MSRSSRLLLLATLTSVAIVAACGGGSAAEPTDGASSPAASMPAESAEPTTEPSADAGAPEPGTAKDACEVITAADVAAATGADPTEVEPGALILTTAFTDDQQAVVTELGTRGLANL